MLSRSEQQWSKTVRIEYEKVSPATRQGASAKASEKGYSVNRDHPFDAIVHIVECQNPCKFSKPRHAIERTAITEWCGREGIELREQPQELAFTSVGNVGKRRMSRLSMGSNRHERKLDLMTARVPKRKR